MRVMAYRLALAAGVVVSSHVFVVAGQREGIELAAGLGGCALLLLAALTGARAMYVALHRDRFRARPSRAWQRGDPGAASFGGVLGALVAVLPLSVALDVSLGTMLDLLAVAGLPGLAIGRVGCLLHGCCPGRGIRVPLQLLQITAALWAWALVLLCTALGAEPGVPFFVGAITWSLLRLITDFLRDLPRGRHGLAVSQVMALGMALAGLLGLLATRLHGAA